VNGKIGSGDIPGAMEASRKAKMWAWWSFGCGLALGVIYAILVALVKAIEGH
jgi:hypothetical protein